MTNQELKRYLRLRGACNEAMSWLGDRNSNQMWSECQRPDWMLWYAAHVLNRKQIVFLACQCARTSLNFVTEGELRPLQAIEAAEKWANGDPVSLQDVRNAADAAYAAYAAVYAADAAYAAYAAVYAADAADAAYAAYAAVYAADAANAAYAAANAAAYAADAVYAAANAADAANLHMCKIIRESFPECPLPILQLKSAWSEV